MLSGICFSILSQPQCDNFMICWYYTDKFSLFLCDNHVLLECATAHLNIYPLYLQPGIPLIPKPVWKNVSRFDARHYNKLTCNKLCRFQCFQGLYSLKHVGPMNLAIRDAIPWSFRYRDKIISIAIWRTVSYINHSPKRIPTTIQGTIITSC